MPLRTQKLQDIYSTNQNKEQQAGVRHLTDDMGTGEMECFQVAPGILLSYDNLNSDSCFQPIIFEKDFLQINYCIEGCYEFEMMDGGVSFMGEGDLNVCGLRKGKQMFASSRIPLKRYRGITMLLEMDIAQKVLNQDFRQGEINLAQIRDTLCPEGRSLLLKSKHEIDRIFNGLSHIDTRIRLPYFWIKIIEVLLFLSLLDSDCVKKPLQFSYEVSKSTQKVYQYIIENPFSKATITELSKMFHVSESSLRRCFTAIAGKSIGMFMKAKRMEAAADLLVTQTQLSICEVANAAGYENQSKFSAAFKSVFGMTPFAWRLKAR